MIRQKYFELLFTAPKKGDHPFRPFAEILTKQLGKGRTETASNMVITEDFTESEVDKIIDRMISNLELIRKKAHKKFELAKIM
jgi:hypothetical protein